MPTTTPMHQLRWMSMGCFQKVKIKAPLVFGEWRKYIPKIKVHTKVTVVFGNQFTADWGPNSQRDQSLFISHSPTKSLSPCYYTPPSLSWSHQHWVIKHFLAPPPSKSCLCLVLSTFLFNAPRTLPSSRLPTMVVRIPANKFSPCI